MEDTAMRWIRAIVMMVTLLAPVSAAWPQSTVTPTPSDESRARAAGWGTGTWRDQHEAINRLARSGNPDVVFLGDSITQSLGGPGRTVGCPVPGLLGKRFPDAGNFGISGDRTQHLLWRIDNGNFDGIDPKVVVLLIGTNNLAHDSAEDIAAGIEAVVERLERTCPTTAIMLCSIVRGKGPDAPLRAKAVRTNELTSPLGGRPRVTLVDLESVFYLPGGAADPSLMAGDFVHFTPEGYRAWMDALEPVVAGARPLPPRDGSGADSVTVDCASVGGELATVGGGE
ncbi:MAG: GDSL-type esterase/lipase family protein [Planctomycetota bacterium]|jgi:lysophospholipase L1-like esterase